MAESPSFCLDSHELRFLSVVKPMGFLMAAEFDLFLAATKAQDQAMTVAFPPLPVEYRKALALCATRFQLTASTPDVGDAATAPVVVSGCAKLPLLRYVDFLPGRLHLDEILTVAGFSIKRTEPQLAPGSEASDFSFTACCTDYSAFEGDEPKFEAGSFFLTIDSGLPLATMAHLIHFTVAKMSTAADAVKSFQRFSHWNKFDLRWDDEEVKRAAVIVLPSTADVHDIFDRYEDEETDDEATLLFRLRPVAPCTHVPYLEDALIRRVREQQWADVKGMWAATTRNQSVPAIVISSLASGNIGDLVSPFAKVGPVADAALIMEEGPQKRRKLYLQMATAEAARAVLALDGQRVVSLPGKPVVRVQVSPPFLNAQRRGHLLSTMQPARSPSPQRDGTSPPPEESSGSGQGKGKKGKKDKAAKGNVEGNAEGKKSRSPQQGSVSPPAGPAAVPSAEATATGGAAGNAASKSTPTGSGKPAPKESRAPKPRSAGGSGASPPATHADPKNMPPLPRESSTGGGMGSPAASAESSAPPMQRENTSAPSDGSSKSPSERASMTKLNSEATPFVPSFSPNPSFAGPPPPYNTPQAGAAPPPYAAPPPPYMGGSPHAGPVAAPPPPPPPYQAAGSPITGGAPAAPPPPYSAGGTPLAAGTSAPPAYVAPPSYAPPPAYQPPQQPSDTADMDTPADSA